MKSLLCILTFSLVALCEARVITFTATSKISQADADKQAMSGVAMQIRADVNSSHTTNKTEVKKAGEKSQLDKSYSETIQVNSDVILNGVEIQHGNFQNGTWTSEAKFDTERATLAARQKLNRILQDGFHQEQRIFEAISANDFQKAVRSYDELMSLQLSHHRLLADISIIQPLDDSYAFRIDVKALEEKIKDAMSALKIVPVGEFPQKISSDTWEPLTFTVQNANGVLAGIPIVAEQNKKILAEAMTDASGKAEFHLKGVESLTGSHEVIFRLHLPQFGVKNPNWEYRASYDSETKKCRIQLQCEGESVSCSAIEDALSKADFMEERGAEPLQVKIQTLDQKVFEGGSRPITTLKLSVSFSGNNLHYSEEVKGSGSSALSAESNAVHKISTQKLKQNLSSICH